jgi:hypothetical protein
VVSRTSTHSINASMSTGDVIQMLKIPKDAQLIDLQVFFQAAGVGSFIVGDGGSTNRYITATVASAAIGVVRLNNTAFVPYTYSVDDTIDIVMSASVNYSAGAIYMIAIINMSPTV